MEASNLEGKAILPKGTDSEASHTVSRIKVHMALYLKKYVLNLPGSFSVDVRNKVVRALEQKERANCGYIACP